MAPLCSPSKRTTAAASGEASPSKKVKSPWPSTVAPAASSPLVDLLGPTLLSSAGEVPTADKLAGKTVALYFSGHWCGPCRGFTPKLVEVYTALKKAGTELEVVFVSSDRSQEGFDEYYGEMPWLALPYADRKRKQKLSKKFKVNGIPSVVVLDGATGETISTDARTAILDDPKGEAFPWRPPTLWEVLGDEVLRGDGESVDVEDLKGPGKVLGFYFSAHWCPPCRAFTPKLVETYKKLAGDKPFEVVFVTGDNSQGEFQDYFKTMPWLALPYGDPRVDKLNTLFDVNGIPALVLVDAETGATITTNGRGAITADPEGAEFPWLPKPVTDLASSCDGINEESCVCAMMEGCSTEAQEAALAALTTVAEASKAAGEDLLFFIATKTEGATSQIRKLTSLGEPSTTPQLLLLDIPDEGGFYRSAATEVTQTSVEAFVAEVKRGEATRQQLK